MQLNRTLECRLLAKCLKDVAAKAINGDAPSVNRLLGCRSKLFSMYSKLINFFQLLTFQLLFLILHSCAIK